MTVQERQKRREAIARDLKANMSPGQVMSKYGVSYSLVYSVAKSEGMKASVKEKKP